MTSITDETGSYDLVNVPDGTYQVTVRYIGYAEMQQTVTVSGKAVKLDFNLINATDNSLQTVVVTGNTGAILKAMNQQKNSDRIVDVISADQIGRFPDANIGDALKRVPGIYVQLDEGEASLVSIRGTDPSKSTININGTSIAGTGNDRSVGINAIPADMVQSVEVTKAITPDMDADVIGGSVNLVTRKAPYSKMLSFTAGSGYSFMIDKPVFNGNFVYGDRFLKSKKLGIIASGSYYRQFLGSDMHGSQWDDVKWVDMKTYFMPNYLNMEQTKLERIRQSYTLGIDYKFNERNSIALTGIYNNYKDWRQKYTLKVDDIGGEHPENWNRAPGYAYKDINDDNGDYIDDDTHEYYVDRSNDPAHPIFYPELERHIEGGVNNRNASETIQKIMNIGLEGKHILGKLTIEWKGSYIKNVGNQPNSRSMELESENEKIVQMDYSDPRFIKADKGFEIENILDDIKGKPSYHADTVDTWYLDNLTGADKRSKTQQYLGQVDFTLPLTEGRFGNTLKFGVKYRGMDKSNVTTTKEKWTPAIDPALKDEYDARVAAGENVKVSDYIGWADFWTSFANHMTNVSKSLFANTDYIVGSSPSAAWVSNLDVSYTGDTKDFIVNKYYQDVLADNYSGNEDIAAAYLMSTQRLGEKLSVIAGVRMEQTRLKYTGYNYNERADFIDHTQVSTNRMFTNLMPSINFKYMPRNNQVYRLVYTRTISRPDYKDLSPYMDVDVHDKTVEEGNPLIKPTLSNNFDLLGEFYPGSTSLVSAGIYFKNIRDYRVDYNSEVHFEDVKQYLLTPEELLAEGANPSSVASYKKDYDKLIAKNDYLEKTVPGNGGKANLLGIELAFQHRLSFLPSFLSNLSLYANYTHNWIFVKKGEPKLPGTADDIMNISLSYEVKRFNARISYNHTSDFLTSLGLTDKDDIYYDKADYLDANINFFITPRLVLFASANNLINQPQRKFQYLNQYTYSTLYTGVTSQIGLKLNVY